MITNELGLPKPFVDAATSTHRYRRGRYSVTDLLGGTCEAVLKRRHHGEGTEDVADRVWAILGTAVHKVLESAPCGPRQRQEYWIHATVSDGYELSGIADLYDADAATVTDWKTCSVWKAQFGDFSDWREQVLMYCWILEQMGRPARRGEVVAIMRDHSARKARFERGYPAHPVLRIVWDFTDDDLREVGERIADWFSEVALQEKLPDDELEPCGSEQRWHKPDKWAVMQSGKKKAIRLFEDEGQAVEYMDQLIDKNGARYRMEHREGEDTKCERYCPVSEWCPHCQSADSEDS